MSDRRLRARVIAAVALSLSACVTSKTGLLKGTNVLGEEFELHLYQK